MVNEEFERIMRRIGFDSKEIAVYLSVLHLGLSKAHSIAEEAHLERRTTYEILKRLELKHLAFSLIKKGIKYFQAVDPKEILEELKENERSFLEILPKLESLSKLSKEKTFIDILVGKEGLRTIFREILSTKKEFLNFGSFSKYDKIDYILWKQLLRDMKKSKISERVLYSEGEEIIEIPTGKYRRLNKGFFIPTSTMIYGDVVVITIFDKESYSLIRIKNKDFADSYKMFFEKIWDNTKNRS